MRKNVYGVDLEILRKTRIQCQGSTVSTVVYERYEGSYLSCCLYLSNLKPTPPTSREALDSISQPCWESHADHFRRSQLRIRTLNRKTEHDKPSLASKNRLKSIGERLLEIAEKLIYVAGLTYVIPVSPTSFLKSRYIDRTFEDRMSYSWLPII